MSDESKIVIKKEKTIIEIPKDELLKSEAIHDGIVFTIRGGLQIHFEQIYMPLEVKSRICHAANKFTGIVTIDLLNYVNPVTVQLQ